MTDPVARLSAALAERYTVEREIGAGGMATVYLARDLRHDRRVALKVLRPELTAVIGTDRFLQEVRVTANLQHPNVLPLYDSGSAGDLLYYVMPYVEGESLRDRLRREGQLPVGDAVAIASAVARALDYANRRDVVHRDIKPENILQHLIEHAHRCRSSLPPPRCWPRRESMERARDWRFARWRWTARSPKRTRHWAA